MVVHKSSSDLDRIITKELGEHKERTAGDIATKHNVNVVKVSERLNVLYRNGLVTGYKEVKGHTVRILWRLKDAKAKV